jgi:hypothetical protein
MSTEHQFLVRLDGLRPDFRTVISFLWSDLHNVDSDGDSYNPASREWTELYLRNREKEEEVVEVLPEEEEPLVLRVVSPFRTIALGVSYFLVHWSSGDILDVDSKKPINQKLVMDELEATFHLTSRIERAERSIWNQSTLEQPYPNLKDA